MRPTLARISLSALAHNVRVLQKIAAPAGLCAVVKADGYGHGLPAVARACLMNGVTCLGVATVEEGATLRDAGLAAPVLVLGGILPADAPAVIHNRLTQTVFEPAAVRALQAAALARGTQAHVHIKLDTGMNRIGLRTPDELQALLRALQDCPNIRVEGAFTHLYGADEPGAAQSVPRQLRRFEELLAPLRGRYENLTLHAANSAGLLCFPQARYGMARPGIALYGAMSDEDNARYGLLPVLSLQTRAVYVKEIEAGEGVGYGHAYTAAQRRKVMTIPVGYGDGYARASGPCGVQAIVRGKLVPVVGRVCMDQATLDVTDVPCAAPGDLVTLIGRDGAQSVSAGQIAHRLGTISYEVLTRLSPRVQRVYDQATP